MNTRERLGDGPGTDCPCCAAWHAEAQRALLLLERLAEDRFPDQETFDRWVEAQMRQVFKPRRAAGEGRDG